MATLEREHVLAIRRGKLAALEPHPVRRVIEREQALLEQAESEDSVDRLAQSAQSSRPHGGHHTLESRFADRQRLEPHAIHEHGVAATGVSGTHPADGL